jgi:hypothetical protein
LKTAAARIRLRTAAALGQLRDPWRPVRATLSNEVPDGRAERRINECGAGFGACV